MASKSQSSAGPPTNEGEAGAEETPEASHRLPLDSLKRVASVAALTLFVFAALHPLSTDPGERLYDPKTFTGAHLNLPDVYLNAWILAWGTHALSTGQITGLFDTNIFHPARNTLAYSEHLLGALPLFAPVYLATGNLALAYNVWILATFLLAALAAWWVALRWFDSHLAALVAALAFAFPPWRLYELAHTQLLSTQYLPLIAWVAWESGRRRDAHLWWLLFALVWLQAASSYYLGYFAFLLAGTLGGARLIMDGEKRGHQALFLGSSLGLAALAMLPLTLPYLRTIPEWTTVWIAEPWSVLTAYLFPALPESSGPNWLGWRSLPAIAVLGAVSGLANRRHRPLVAGLLLIAILGILLMIGVSGSLFSLDVRWFQHLLAELVPGWTSLRVWSRFAILAWFPICFLAALALARSAHWFGHRRWPPRLLGTMLLVVLTWPVLKVPLRTLDPPDAAPSIAAEHWLAEHGDGAPVLHLPMTRPADNGAYMYRSTLHWAPLLNGYSGYKPPTYELILSLATALPEPRAAETLEALGLARWVVVHRSRLNPRDRRIWSPPDFGGLALRHRGPGFLIFELAYQANRSNSLFDTQARVSLLGTPLEELRPEDLVAEFILPGPELATRSRFRMRIPVEVRNRSTRRWPAVAAKRSGLVGVRFRVVGESGAAIPTEQDFSRLPADLSPGETVTLVAVIRPPREPGRYQVIPCVVQAGFAAEHCQIAKATPLRVGAVPRPSP